MKSVIATATVSLGLVFAISLAFADGPKKKDEEVDVKKLMDAAHKGKDSPLAIVKAQVKLEKPDWQRLEKNTKPLANLAGAIKDNESYTSRPGPYVKAVKSLAVATKQKDIEKARAAVVGLTKSCAGCHRDK